MQGDRESFDQRDTQRKTRRQMSGKAPRRPCAESLAHHQSQIEARDVHELALEHVRVPSQVRSAHASGLERVREAAFE